MRAPVWPCVALLLVAAACAPEAPDAEARDQGRTYTAWLQDREFEKLWERFSPEMQRTFASSADLAAFAGQAMADLNGETGAPDETVTQEDTLMVYTRRAALANSGSQVVVQWTLTQDGKVTGFVVRPAVALSPG
ncbi:MAG TPA: hypothetical protein VFS94_05930 [Gemmatimonadales bacterium]|nr:hypothetical protein [Gemmatimonadales bacterium]